jgi:hypothetical protein
MTTWPCPTPCSQSHRRCDTCGWLLLDGEASTTDPRECRHCEEARS